MPTKQGGRALKNASTSDRCSFRRNTALASCIDPVQLEDTLGDVQTDCGNLHGGRLLQLVALNGPSLAQRCRQGSSTASDFINKRRSRGAVPVVTQADKGGAKSDNIAYRK